MITATNVAQFCSVVEERLGLHFEEARLGLLASVVEQRLRLVGLPAAEYLKQLEAEDSTKEWGAIAEALTVSETYFFRNNDQFRALTESILPELIPQGSRGAGLRILSAGCASGEEPYSIAMLVHDSANNNRWNVAITGVDIGARVLEKARRARFSAWALRETPEDMRARWFRKDGNDFLLDPVIQRSVRFEKRNLAEDDAELWQRSSYDVVFCRNVVMYFAPARARSLIARVTASLKPGGYLFLGHAETLRGLSNSYHLCHSHETFYYRRKEEIEGAVAAGVHVHDSSQVPYRVPAANDLSPASWIETIRSSGERVRELAEVPFPLPAASSPTAAAATPRWDLRTVFELLQKERFSEALDVIGSLPPDSKRDPDVLLLRAALLTDSGQLKPAAECCRKLLEVDELSAGARYLLALCYEGAADDKQAIEQDHIAIYLDPGFAMPRLHLGLIARRQGQHGVARQQLGHALPLLHQEDASRVVLFGGGFSRSALIALCQNELLACGGVA